MVPSAMIETDDEDRRPNELPIKTNQSPQTMSKSERLTVNSEHFAKMLERNKQRAEQSTKRQTLDTPSLRPKIDLLTDKFNRVSTPAPKAQSTMPILVREPQPPTTPSPPISNPARKTTVRAPKRKAESEEPESPREAKHTR